MIASHDFMCHVCCTMTFQGEEMYFVVNHPIHDNIKLCALCGSAAERLGWIIQ